MIFLQFFVIKMAASLSYTCSFTDLNQNSSISVVKSEPFFVPSPSSKLLALVEHDHISIFDTSNYTQIKIININATSAVFDISQESLIITNSYQLQSVSLDGKLIQTILDNNDLNHISSLVYSPDLKRIYFTNGSKLIYYQPHLKTIKYVTNQSSICPADSIFIDSIAQVLLTSSYDCKLCSYSIRTKQPILISNNTISQCRIGNIVFANGYGFLTQDSITTSLPQIMTLNLQTLAIVSTINQTSAFPLSTLSFHNYLLSYGRQDDTVWIYRDSLNNRPNKVKFNKSIIGMVSNTIKNEAYVILGNRNQEYVEFQSWKLSFNCSAIQNTANNSASVFLENCNCRGGMLFDPSKQICSRSQCKNTKQSPCKCPHQQSFNSFTTKCQLDCYQFYNTLTPISFGNPSSCSCKYPFQWNSELSDCSWIDCSLIEHTEPSNYSSKCICQSGFTWNDSSLSCKFNDTVIPVASASDNSVSVGLILGIIFLIILVIVSAIIYYVKKYRVSEQDLPKTFEYVPKYEQHNPTPRPLAFENYIKSDCQLAQRDREGKNQGQLPNN